MVNDDREDWIVNNDEEDWYSTNELVSPVGRGRTIRGRSAGHFINGMEGLCNQQTIATHAGVSVATIRKWQQRYQEFPSPVTHTGRFNQSPMFNWVSVRHWLIDTGRNVND